MYLGNCMEYTADIKLNFKISNGFLRVYEKNFLQ